MAGEPAAGARGFGLANLVDKPELAFAQRHMHHTDILKINSVEIISIIIIDFPNLNYIQRYLR